MKKIILASFMAFSLLMLSGCDDCNCPTSVYDGVYTQNFYQTLYSNDWKTDQYDGAGHWFCELIFPEITPSVLSDGAVLVYYMNEYENWVLLPYSTEYFDTYSGTKYNVEYWAGFRNGYLDIDYVNFFTKIPPARLDLKITIIRY